MVSRWLLPLPLAATALAIAVDLWLHAGQTVLGFGPAGGCDGVLASRWSRWLGVPVSGLAVGLYATVIVLLPLSSWQAWAWTPLRVSAVVIVGAALWMLGLQAFVLGQLCPSCLAIHLVGLATAAAILILGPRPWRMAWQGILLLGSIGVAAFVAGTSASPEPTAVVESRPFPLLDGRAAVDLNSLPFLGSLDARHVGVLLFDYTCPQCRFLHGLLGRCLRRYGEEQIAFALLPVPLESRCNPAVTVVEPRREGACDYARLALAVWQASPERFPEFDAFLAEGPKPPGVAAATTRAQELIGAARLSAILAARPGSEAARINAVLQQGLAAYEQSGGGPLPKLLFSGVVLTGQTNKIMELYDTLELHLGIEMRP